MGASSRKICLMIDGDNTSSKYITPIINEINNKGDIIIKRIYGDWTSNYMNSWKDIINKHAIRPVQQFRYGPDATDQALIMDSLDITHTNRIVDTFCIVTSDVDFYGLYNRLREQGYYVIGMGMKKTTDLLKRSCNEFIYLENLLIEEEKPAVKEAIKPSVPKEEFGLKDLNDMLIDAYQKCSQDIEGWVYLSFYGDILKKNNPDFDPRSYGHKNLLSILRSLSSLFDVKEDRSAPLTYLIKLKMEMKEKEHLKEGKISRYGNNSYGFIKSDDGAYYFNSTNIIENRSGHEVKVGLSVRFRVFKRPDPDGKSSEEKNGIASEVIVL